MSLRIRSAVPSTWKRFFSSFRKLQKLSFAFSSCPVTPQSDFIVLHIASSILKAISHALTGPISSRSMPSNAVFYSRKLNLPNKILTLSSSQQTSTKRREKGNRIWRHTTWPKIKKSINLRISPTHSEYAAYNGSGCLDTCKCRKRFDPIRVDALKISGSLRSGYLDTCKRSLRFLPRERVMVFQCWKTEKKITKLWIERSYNNKLLGRKLKILRQLM